MKKQIIFLLLALLVVCMSACKEETAKTMTLNPDAAIIGVGESLIIQPSVSGNGKWTSSDESVAVVSDGIVIGIGIGSATITATINDHVGTATIHVVDKGTTPTTYRSMALSPELTILEAGKTQQLTPAVSGTIRWSSSNPSAVSIAGGIATAVGEGKSVVRAVVGSNEGKAVVYAVQSGARSLTGQKTVLTPDTFSVELNKTKTIQNVTSATMKITTSDASIAAVSDGTIKGVAEGKASVTVTIGDYEVPLVVYVIQEGGSYQGEYELVWEDEFDGTSLDESKWNIETGGGGWGNQEKQYYTAREENLRVRNGNLEIEARKEDYYNNSYTSARINTKNKFDIAYGKIEARIKMPGGGGTWPAFWMLGYGSWPTCGEIDIVEHVGNNPTFASHAVHTRQKNGSRGNNWHAGLYMDNLVGEYHVYGIEWLRTYRMGVDAIRFYVDGRVGGTTYASTVSTFEDWPFTDDRPEYIIMNMAIGGTMGGTINNDIFVEGNNPTMYVDWVRVYQKKM